MAKKILNALLIIFAILGVVIIGLYIYFVNNYNDKTVVDVQVQNGIVTNPEDVDILEESEIENPPLMEFNYYSNANINGEKLRELKFTYFTNADASLDSMYTSGMQYVGEIDYSLLEIDLKFNVKNAVNTINELTENRIKFLDNYNYYDGQTDGNGNYQGWASERRLPTNNNGEGFIITIDDQVFMLVLDGTFDYYYKILGITQKTTLKYNCSDLFLYVSKIAESCGAGYGEYFVNADLTPFFTIKQYNSATGHFENMSVNSKYEQWFTKVPIKINYFKDGYTTAEQSFFGSIDYNSQVDNSNHADVDIWKVYDVYDFTNEDFSLTYSNFYEGYLLNLKPTSIKEIDLTKNNVKLNVNIELSKFDKKVVGLNSLCFNNLGKIETLTIDSANEEMNFYFLNSSLYLTDYETIQFSENITPIYKDNWHVSAELLEGGVA